MKMLPKKMVPTERQGALNALSRHLTSTQAHWANAVPSSLARTLRPERIAKIVVMAASRNPRLAECTLSSIVRSVTEILSLGLEPDGPQKQAYLVPFFNKHVGKYEASVMIGYKGLMALARRSPEIVDVNAQVVCKNDACHVHLGTRNEILHEPPLSDRGEMVAVYAVAKLRDGGTQIELMSKSQVDAVRDASARSKDVWAAHYDEMARKTVIRRAAKWWPASIDLADAFALEDEGATVRVAEMDDIIDAQLPDNDEGAETITVDNSVKDGQSTTPETQFDPKAAVAQLRALAEGKNGAPE